MAFFDMPLEQLQSYLPPRHEAPDFDSFWQNTLASARTYPLDAQFTAVNTGLNLIDGFDVTFSGYAGQRIKGWLLLPKARTGNLPCVVEYIGYGGGRGFIQEWLFWVNAGYAYFIMDTRGQGSSWRKGDTPDIAEGDNPQFPGFMTRGIFSPETYYYRRVFTDAVRAVEAAKSHEAVNSELIAVKGGSQGGGITLAVAGLVGGLSAVMPDVPFLCHYKRATTMVDTMPYGEISKFLKTHRDKVETVFNTLSYFDGVNFATRATAPSLFSVGLMDTTCPPSTVYAAYNHYAGQKDIAIYDFNEHEGGGMEQVILQMKTLEKIFA